MGSTSANRRPRSGSTSSAGGGGGGRPSAASPSSGRSPKKATGTGRDVGPIADPGLGLRRRDRFGRTELHCLASSSPPSSSGAAPAVSPLVRARDLLEFALRLDREGRRRQLRLLRRQDSDPQAQAHQSQSPSGGRGGGRPRSNSAGGAVIGRPRSNSAGGGGGSSPATSNHGKNNHDGNAQNARDLLLGRDVESGYTALHRAAYSRDLCMVLLLLRYAAALRHDDDDEDDDLEGGDVLIGNDSKKMKKRRRNNHANFMTLLECPGPAADAGNNHNGGGGAYRRGRSNSLSSSSPSPTTRTVEEMSSTRDGEGLTPLRLLGELYSADLGKTVDEIRLRAKRDRASRAATASATPTSDSLLLGEDEDGGQFHLDEEEPTPDEDTISFPTYRPVPQAVAETTTTTAWENVASAGSSETCTYGTEVVTFGRSDHAALGHFHHCSGSSSSSSSSDHAASPSSSSVAASSISSSSSSQSILLGRVEEFALPARGGDWGHLLEEKGSGAAVAVAAAAHHTLVATANGHLYSFGLGKAGRLGTGDERHQLMPRRVLGPLARRRVSSIAASENHSLCSTSDGSVYAWGSNRFGQLGVTRGATSSTASTAILSLPTRVDGLKRVFITKVAGGDRHSVALARSGAVYCWGDNRAGQLGWTPYRASSEPAPFASSGTTVTSSAPLTTHVHRVGRVDALWSANPQRLAIDIAAGDKTTLAITRAPQREGFANCVYGWGHGSYNPIKINFPTDDKSASYQLRSQHDHSGGSNFSSKRDVVDPVGIACAKYHNVAIAADGRVYTWGVHTDPLPRETPAVSAENAAGWNNTTKKTSSPKVSSSGGAFVSSNADHYKVTSPQLVTAMLPENGGGRATAVSASEHHTAVLTTTGHLFTWGAPDGSHVLGHRGVKYQPQPKRVPGVVRAISVAAARDHTALLIGTTVPPEGSIVEEAFTCGTFAECWPTRVPSLQRLAERAAARHVDLYNVIPVLIMAERLHATGLIRYCADFVSSNLDGVLAVAKKNDLDCLIDERLTSLSLPDSVSCEDMDTRDHIFWPCVGNVDEEGFASGSSSARVQLGGEARAKRHQLSDTNGIPFPSDGTGSKVGCSERMALLMAERPDLNNPGEVAERYQSLSKVARSLKKKLNLVAELEKATQQSLATGASCDGECSRAVSELTVEQHEKLARKPMLQADLATLEPALEEIERRMVHFNLCKRKNPDATLQFPDAKDSSTKVQSKESVSRKLFATEEEAAPTKSAPDQAKDASTGEASAVARCRCEVCDVTCPDLSSLSLHMNGRKHRNRVRHLEDIDKRETAARMMETKQRQMMLRSAQEVDESKMPAKVASNAWHQQALGEPPGVRSKPVPLCGKYGELQKDEVSIQLRYSLAPRPAADESCMAEKVIPWSGTAALVSSEAIPRNKKSRVKVPATSFQKIVQEEEQKKTATVSSRYFRDVGIKNKTQTQETQRAQRLAARTNPSSFGMDPQKKSNTGDSSAGLSTSPPSTSFSLSSFFEKETGKTKARKEPPLGSQSPRHHPWSKNNDGKESTNSCKKSFDEIQREEEDFKAKEKSGAAKDAKWFIQRRERAPSIGDIQKKEEEDRQFSMLIEEQKAIEAQIAREVQAKERDRKKTARAESRRGNKSKRRGTHGDGRTTGNGAASPSTEQDEMKGDTGFSRERKGHRKRNGARGQRRWKQSSTGKKEPNTE